MLALILIPLYLIAAPFLWLGSAILSMGLWPFSFVLRFETPFIFLGLAILTGAISGIILHCTCTFAVDYLPGYFLASLPQRKRQQPRDQNQVLDRDLKKETRTPQKPLRDPAPSVDYNYSAPWTGIGKGAAGPLSLTILEEEESGQESTGGRLEYEYEYE